MSNTPAIVPVVLCGGSGTRLWPMSREKMPKQFLRLIGEDTLLQATVKRAMKVARTPASHILTVTLGAMEAEIMEQYAPIDPALSSHILCEPMPRNTSAAVAFAAEYAARNFGPETVLWIVAADAHMGDIIDLGRALDAAVIAAQQGYLVTFGITPSRAETGYGYIKCKGKLASVDDVMEVERFVEKPDRERAQQFLDSGEYLWNSGMFVFTARDVLENFEKHAADTLAIVRGALDKNPAARTIAADIYATIPEAPFDKSIMEKSERVAVVPCDPQWSDIGSWESLWEISDKDENGNAVQGPVYLAQSKGCIVRSDKKLIGCAGLENIVVIETADSILIADKSNGDAIKQLVTRLRKEGAPEAFEKPSASNIRSVSGK